MLTTAFHATTSSCTASWQQKWVLMCSSPSESWACIIEAASENQSEKLQQLVNAGNPELPIKVSK